jgi:tRNA A-37 threonylcarbamoyl transferase component Bud32
MQPSLRRPTVPECPTCGKQLDPSVRFCPDDGTPLTETAASTAVHTPTSKPAKSKELILPVLLGNRYRLVEARGGGGMAKVYRAVDVTLEREVAVKLINPDLREEPEFDNRFQREARIASQLADPHIVVVHDFGLDTTHGPYLVMEYLQGQSLREHLQTQGPMPLKAVLQLSAQLLLALIHAHEKGIVHRDIKPDNIFLLNQSGVRLHVRVLDFGIARIFRRDEPTHAETLTRPGAVLGTPRYMSPEQLAGQPVDARSDLYSAGLVIYEALTGTLPYVSHKKLTEICPDIPAAFNDVLSQCLLQNPAERPASAIEVYLRLQEPARASGVLLLPPGAMDKLAAASKAQQEATVAYVPAARTPWWKRRTILGIALLALLAILVLFGLLLFRSHSGKTASARESLLGLEIGSSLYDVIAKFPNVPPRELTGDPWKGDAVPALGHVLTRDDLGDEDVLNNLKVLLWHNDTACVILHDNIVRAVVIRAPYRAATGRGLAIHDKESYLKDLYLEKPTSITPLDAPSSTAKTAAKSSNYLEVHRYDDLGVGFEVQHKRITSITLYPPSPGETKAE